MCPCSSGTQSRSPSSRRSWQAKTRSSPSIPRSSFPNTSSRDLTDFISDKLFRCDAVGDVESKKGRQKLTKKLFKCFECGKIYEDEQSAMKCHNAPIQRVFEPDGKKKPRFLGN